MNDLKIFILAGGFGTRLQSIVKDVPKPMALIDTKPFLEYQIKEIRKSFPKNKIYLLTYYLSEVIENYFKNDELVFIIKEEKPLGTGGSIKNAINFLKLSNDDPILILNGDTYIKPDLNNLINNINNDILIIGSFQNNCDRYGTLKIEKNKIIDFSEKEVGIRDAYINAGCYYFKNLDFFTLIKESQFAIEDKFKEYLLTNKIDIFRYNDIFIDIGIPDDYIKMVNYIKKLKKND